MMTTDTLRDGGRLTDTEPGAAAPHIPPQALSAPLREVARAFRAKPFVPHPLLRGPHAQTVVASVDPARPEPPPLPPDAPQPTAPVREPGTPVPAGDPPASEPTRLA